MFATHTLPEDKPDLLETWNAASMQKKFNPNELEKLKIGKICKEIMDDTISIVHSGILTTEVICLYKQKLNHLVAELTQVQDKIQILLGVKAAPSPTAHARGLRLENGEQSNDSTANNDQGYEDDTRNDETACSDMRLENIDGASQHNNEIQGDGIRSMRHSVSSEADFAEVNLGRANNERPYTSSGNCLETTSVENIVRSSEQMVEPGPAQMQSPVSNHPIYQDYQITIPRLRELKDRLEKPEGPKGSQSLNELARGMNPSQAAELFCEVLGLSATLIGVRGSRFKKTGKILPAGVVSVVSFIMTGGYLHGIMHGMH